MKHVIMVVCAALLAGCASKSEDIEATYVTSSKYADMSCKNIAAAAQELSSALSQASIAQNKKASDDATATTIASILFWPAAFMIGGDDETASQVSRLKGEMQAIEKASADKGCNIQFGSEEKTEET